MRFKKLDTFDVLRTAKLFCRGTKPESARQGRLLHVSKIY